MNIYFRKEITLKKQVIISGPHVIFTLFGAGNLIFPPMLTHTAVKICGLQGFSLQYILPFITVIVVAFYDEGVVNMVRIFAVVIYMSIGAFGIPRAANVAQ